MDRRTVAKWLEYLAVRIAICFVQSLRIETCASLARWVAWLATDLLKVRHRVVTENLRNVFPDRSDAELRQLTWQMWEHLVLMVCETAHAPRKIHRTNWQHHIRVRDRRQLVKHLLDPRPTLLVSGHFGNFEVGGFVTGLLGFPSYTVARKLDNPFLDKYLARFRRANGQFLVSKSDSAKRIDSLLASGATLTLLGDQHAGRHGCWVEFFGRPAACHKAIALFSLTSNAPMVVAYTRRLGRPMNFEMGLSGAFDPACGDDKLMGVRPLTQWYNQRLEEVVRLAPQQYWWVHRRWKPPNPKLMRQVSQNPRAA